MNSKILGKMGLAGLDPGYLVIGMIVVSILLIIVAVLLVMQIRKTNALKARLDKFTTGKEGESLEEDIISLYEDNKFLKSNVQTNQENIATLFQNMENTFQKMGLVKYDAFQQMGGQLSFCLALLDENNNGFIINSVHSTEGCYSYSKEIRNGECAISLGKEEEEALGIAMDGGE